MLPAKEAKALILSAQAPANLRVRGHLDLSNNATLTALPEGLRATSLDLYSCTALRALPSGLCVRFKLDLTGCTALTHLPAGLKAGTLILRNCTALYTLPEGLEASFLDISGCTALTRWPEHARVQAGRFEAAGCTQLSLLPPWLSDLAQLDVRDCTNLTELPKGLHVSAWIDLANTGLRGLPPGCQDAQLRWRGVPINARIAFHPETITPQDILEEANVELRRVLIERVGYDAFLQAAKAEIIDADYDAGGTRQLLRVPLENDEPLVCLSVICPSTGRQYVIRVPPGMESCRHAAAWIAGFDDPDAYAPLVET